MAHHWHHHTQILTRPDQQLTYHLFTRPPSQCLTPGRLLLLHGAGVAGELTWSGILRRLSHWHEVLVPDLRGMGQTRAPDGIERPFTVEQVRDDVLQLLDQRGWFDFDLAGYSFGGLIAMLVAQSRPGVVKHTALLEPALMERADLATLQRVRQDYSDTAAAMRSGDAAQRQTGIVKFLDRVSPHRSSSTRVEQATIHRLAHRPEGFSYALDAVTDAVNRLDREALFAAQRQVMTFYGGRSPEPLQQFHRQMAETRTDWQCVEVPGTDHALPYQKPQRIARGLDQFYGIVDNGAV